MDTIDSFVPVQVFLVTHDWNGEINEVNLNDKAKAIDYARRYHGTWEQLYRKLPKCTAKPSDVTTVLNENTGTEVIEPASAVEIMQLEAESSQSCQCINPTTCPSSTSNC